MGTTTPQLCDGNSCLDLALRHAYYFRRWASVRGMEWEDLICEARLACVYAANRFRPERGNQFAAYAAKAIRNALSNAIRQHHRFLSMMTADGHRVEPVARSLPDPDAVMDVQALLQKLPHQERELLERRYGLMDGEEWGTRRLAAARRMKEERICFVLHRALTILRCHLGLLSELQLRRCVRENSSCRITTTEHES